MSKDTIMEPERRPARVLLREADELCMKIAASSELVEALLSAKPSLPASWYPDKFIGPKLPVIPKYPPRKVASNPIAERMRQCNNRSIIVRGLADFLMYSFLCDVRYRIAFVENRSDGQHVLPDVISLLDGTDGYLTSFEELDISRHLIEQRFSSRNRQFAFIDIEEWSVYPDNYDFVGPSPDQRSTLLGLSAEMRKLEGLHLCLEMSISEVNSRLLSILQVPSPMAPPMLPSILLPQPSDGHTEKKNSYSKLEVRKLLSDIFEFIEEVGTEWVTKKYLKNRFAREWKEKWWVTEIQPKLVERHSELGRAGPRLPIPEEY